MFYSEYWSKVCAEYLETAKGNKSLSIWAVREALTAVVVCELRGARIAVSRAC